MSCGRTHAVYFVELLFIYPITKSGLFSPWQEILSPPLLQNKGHSPRTSDFPHSSPPHNPDCPHSSPPHSMSSPPFGPICQVSWQKQTKKAALRRYHLGLSCPGPSLPVTLSLVCLQLLSVYLTYKLRISPCVTLISLLCTTEV